MSIHNYSYSSTPAFAAGPGMDIYRTDGFAHLAMSSTSINKHAAEWLGENENNTAFLKRFVPGVVAFIGDDIADGLKHSKDFDPALYNFLKRHALPQLKLWEATVRDAFSKVKGLRKLSEEDIQLLSRCIDAYARDFIEYHQDKWEKRSQGVQGQAAAKAPETKAPPKPSMLSSGAIGLTPPQLFQSKFIEVDMEDIVEPAGDEEMADRAPAMTPTTATQVVDIDMDDHDATTNTVQATSEVMPTISTEIVMVDAVPRSLWASTSLRMKVKETAHKVKKWASSPTDKKKKTEAALPNVRYKSKSKVAVVVEALSLSQTSETVLRRIKKTFNPQSQSKMAKGIEKELYRRDEWIRSRSASMEREIARRQSQDSGIGMGGSSPSPSTVTASPPPASQCNDVDMDAEDMTSTLSTQPLVTAPPQAPPATSPAAPQKPAPTVDNIIKDFAKMHIGKRAPEPSLPKTLCDVGLSTPFYIMGMDRDLKAVPIGKFVTGEKIIAIVRQPRDGAGSGETVTPQTIYDVVAKSQSEAENEPMLMAAFAKCREAELAAKAAKETVVTSIDDLVEDTVVKASAEPAKPAKAGAKMTLGTGKPDAFKIGRKAHEKPKSAVLSQIKARGTAGEVQMSAKWKASTLQLSTTLGAASPSTGKTGAKPVAVKSRGTRRPTAVQVTTMASNTVTHVAAKDNKASETTSLASSSTSSLNDASDNSTPASSVSGSSLATFATAFKSASKRKHGAIDGYECNEKEDAAPEAIAKRKIKSLRRRLPSKINSVPQVLFFGACTSSSRQLSKDETTERPAKKMRKM